MAEALHDVSTKHSYFVAFGPTFVLGLAFFFFYNNTRAYPPSRPTRYVLICTHEYKIQAILNFYIVDAYPGINSGILLVLSYSLDGTKLVRIIPSDRF